MTANLPYGPSVNTDIDYYRSFSDFLAALAAPSLNSCHLVIPGVYF